MNIRKKAEVSAAQFRHDSEADSRIRTSELIGKMSDSEFVEMMVRCHKRGQIKLSPGSVRSWLEVYAGCVGSRFGARHHLAGRIANRLAR